MLATPTVESIQFQAETTRLLSLMIHSLYIQREIFLRELISNVSDALDRLSFEALTDPELVEPNHKYEIRLKPDVSLRTLTVQDAGIGMSRQQLIDHIGTIARSGTGELRKRIQESRSAESGPTGGRSRCYLVGLERRWFLHSCRNRKRRVRD